MFSRVASSVRAAQYAVCQPRCRASAATASARTVLPMPRWPVRTTNARGCRLVAANTVAMASLNGERPARTGGIEEKPGRNGFWSVVIDARHY